MVLMPPVLKFDFFSVIADLDSRLVMINHIVSYLGGNMASLIDLGLDSFLFGD